ELLLDTITVAGPAGWSATIERISRGDWDYTAADWTRFKVGSNWTLAGGDVATPPAAVAFTSPSLAGEQIIAGMAAYVTDAMANRGGRVLLRLKAVDEAPAQSQWVAYQANLESPARPRLRVTYVAAEPAPISGNDGGGVLGDHEARAAPVERLVGVERPESSERPETAAPPDHR
ncbi:MAG: hypothetical protein HY873_08915, partial [Chloroflexi bacterium]|nr:hypothetical protein [Chloroflexota bacterium]